MNQSEKVSQSARLIQRILLPMIDDDYVIYGLPYHNNVGDVLIWEGELQLLKKVPHRCVGVSAYNEARTKRLNSNTIILLHGGCYIGDTWRTHWVKMMQSIANNPDNRIIILPSMVRYTNHELRQKDAEFLARFSRLTICVRDEHSLREAKEHFSNEVVLVPDMSMAIDPAYLHSKLVRPTAKRLYLRRPDMEIDTHRFTGIQTELRGKDGWITDWPTMCCDNYSLRDSLLIGSVKRRIDRTLQALPMTSPLRRWLYKNLHRKAITSRGVAFLSTYEDIYTTRLHGMLLAIMLGKKVSFVDNANGKLTSYYETWLSDCDNVSRTDTLPIKKPHEQQYWLDGRYKVH